MPGPRQRHRQVDRDSGFADAALAGGHSDDRLHLRQQQRRLLSGAGMCMRRMSVSLLRCGSARRRRGGGGRGFVCGQHRGGIGDAGSAASAPARPRGAPAPSPRRAPGRSAASTCTSPSRNSIGFHQAGGDDVAARGRIFDFPQRVTQRVRGCCHRLAPWLLQSIARHRISGRATAPVSKHMAHRAASASGPLVRVACQE